MDNQNRTQTENPSAWTRRPNQSWCRNCVNLAQTETGWACGVQGEEESGVMRWVMCLIDGRRTVLSEEPPIHWEEA